MDFAKRQPGRKEKKLAFQVLYSFMFAPPENLDDVRAAYYFSFNDNGAHQEVQQDEPSGYAWELIKGVWENTDAINAMIEEYSRNWPLRRMGKIELTILRLALFELIRKQMQPRLIISDAMALAAEYATEKAKIFIGSILDTASRKLSEINRK